MDDKKELLEHSSEPTEPKIPENMPADSEEHLETPPHDSADLLKRMGLSRKDKHKKELAEWKQKAADSTDKYLRLYAEFENFKKRSMKDRIEFSKLANQDILLSLLPVLDDFQRAMKQLENNNDTESIKEGILLIQQKLNAALESKGLKKMDSQGQPFNSEFHEAITEIPVTEESMKGKVVDEIESGYTLFDKIIRYAKVVVGK